MLTKNREIFTKMIIFLIIFAAFFIATGCNTTTQGLTYMNLDRTENKEVVCYSRGYNSLWCYKK